MEIHVLNPFVDSEKIWLGLDTDGLRRKVFRVVNQELVDAEHIAAGLTIFDPGEASSLHGHADSEEIDFIAKGRGEVVSGSERAEFGENSFMFIPKVDPSVNGSDGTSLASRTVPDPSNS